MGRQDKEQCDFDKNERFSLTEIDKVLIELLITINEFRKFFLKLNDKFHGHNC